jgi:hypothetical protein
MSIRIRLGLFRKKIEPDVIKKSIVIQFNLPKRSIVILAILLAIILLLIPLITKSMPTKQRTRCEVYQSEMFHLHKHLIQYIIVL